MSSESLRVVSGPAAGNEIGLEADEFLIGRASEGDGTLGEDPEISRRHARISRRAGDQLTIEDLGSTNGTLVNDKKIEGAIPLTPGDTIKVGTTVLQVLDAAGGAPQATRLATPVPDLEDEDKTKQRPIPAAAAPPPPAAEPPPPAAPSAPAAPAEPAIPAPAAAPPPIPAPSAPIPPPREARPATPPQRPTSPSSGDGNRGILIAIAVLVAAIVAGILLFGVVL